MNDLPDIIERGEARASAAHAEATAGIPAGKYRCPGCKQVRDAEDMHAMSADPYASPGCGACLEDFMVEAFGRRAVACKAWRWMPGMLCLYTAVGGLTRLRVIMEPDFGWPEPQRNEWGVPIIGKYAGALGEPAMHAPSGGWPDLRDDATIGCLLALVREVWGDPTICVVTVEKDHGWIVRDEYGQVRGRGDIEAEALVRALYAAPEAETTP